MNKRLRRYALVSLLVKKLNEHESWCGETHIQKAMYFLKELFPDIVDYPFMLYKYGPFSFELRDDLGIMVSEKILRLIPKFPYGPKIIPDTLAEKILSLFPKTTTKWENKIEFIGEKLGDKDIRELEVLATALYVIKNNPDMSSVEKIETLQRLKPHIPFPKAKKAIQEVQKVIKEVQIKWQ